MNLISLLLSFLFSIHSYLPYTYIPSEKNPPHTRWSAKKCFEKHYYLCQHPMPFVGDRARQRVYTKWNETYPGQFANEVQVFVATNGTNRR